MNTTQHWEDELLKLTQEFKNEFEGLSLDQLNFKPNAKTWSIAQIMDHIIRVNETYYPILRNLFEGKFVLPLIGRWGWASTFFGNLIHNSVEPLRKKKARTLPLWEPSSSAVDVAILTRFQQHQEDLVQHIKMCAPLIEKGIVIHSPASKVIVYKLDKAFDIIVTHERRHFNQAMEVKALIK
jgi:uncharacterized damage-inducible protein DinB